MLYKFKLHVILSYQSDARDTKNSFLDLHELVKPNCGKRRISEAIPSYGLMIANVIDERGDLDTIFSICKIISLECYSVGGGAKELPKSVSKGFLSCLP